MAHSVPPQPPVPVLHGTAVAAALRQLADYAEQDQIQITGWDQHEYPSLKSGSLTIKWSWRGR